MLMDNGLTVQPSPTLTPASVSAGQRQKFEIAVNSGSGQIGYRASITLSGSFTVAPILYQMDIGAAVLAESRASFDSYWIKFGVEESKLVKQLYLDYTSSNSLLCAVYADGNTIPYYQFTLGSNPARAEVPVRVRLPAIKLRQFRLIVQSSVAGAGFQFWVAPRVEWKPVIEGKGYQVYEITTE
jgi:hypothetical protein